MSEERQPFTIAWAIKMVERAFRRHGMTNDEEFEFYKQVPIQNPSDYSKPRNDAQLTQDLNVAHDNIRKLVKTNDRLRAKIEQEALYRKILTYGLMGAWGALGSLTAAVLHYLLK